MYHSKTVADDILYVGAAKAMRRWLVQCSVCKEQKTTTDKKGRLSIVDFFSNCNCSSLYYNQRPKLHPCHYVRRYTCGCKRMGRARLAVTQKSCYPKD